MLAAYAADVAGSTKRGAQAIQADRSFVWEMRTWARAVQAAGNDAYLYFFSQAPPVFRIYVPERAAIDLPDGPRGYGAYHSGDLAYVFANTRLVGIDWTDWDHELSDAMSRYWVNFARTGNPNGGNLPAWPRYATEADEWLEFGSELRVTTGGAEGEARPVRRRERAAGAVARAGRTHRPHLARSVNHGLPNSRLMRHVSLPWSPRYTSR